MNNLTGRSLWALMRLVPGTRKSSTSKLLSRKVDFYETTDMSNLP